MQWAKMRLISMAHRKAILKDSSESNGNRINLWPSTTNRYGMFWYHYSLRDRESEVKELFGIKVKICGRSSGMR
jgi:hypothetical protein